MLRSLITSKATMSTAEFLRAMLNAAEKAANIARACRQEKELFKLLVQEKSGIEKNKRFLQDFKTLADVLIQETFPEIADNIKGEESNMFTNTLGESISVQVQDLEEETSALLCKVLDGDKKAADLLAKEVHQDVQVNDILNNLKSHNDLPLDTLGIWIDPIDSTAEYIQGDSMEPGPSGIYASGLRCVTVLIGAYKRTTGEPVLGVVNQPFHEFDEQIKSWRGRHFWGVSLDDGRSSSLQRCSEKKGVVLLSSSESQQLKKHLAHRYTVVEAAGAGYKQLCVALGLADVYILSRGSTFRWDCCAPHAVLNSLGGGIVSYKQFTSLPSELHTSTDMQIKYNKEGGSGWCNEEGIIAYASQENLKDLLPFIQVNDS
ncbi:hypothetical protein B566_EDAN001741 [Ephemera danica]|nr:hypothetical protein B566_EDAN001741 [Ephemera danica]